MQPSKLFSIVPQRTLYSVAQAPAPKFIDRGIEKNRGPMAKQFAVLLLHESAATEGDYAIAMKRSGQKVLKSRRFDQPKTGLAAFPKNLGNRLPQARLDSRIQIHELPTQTPGKFRADAALTGGHESDQKDRTTAHAPPSKAVRNHPAGVFP
jgi:hypothetical protein